MPLKLHVQCARTVFQCLTNGRVRRQLYLPWTAIQQHVCCSEVSTIPLLPTSSKIIFVDHILTFLLIMASGSELDELSVRLQRGTDYYKNNQFSKAAVVFKEVGSCRLHGSLTR